MKGTWGEILQVIWTIEPPGFPDELHKREKKRGVEDVGISNLKSQSMEVGKRVEQVVKEGRDLLDNLGLICLLDIQVALLTVQMEVRISGENLGWK